MVTIKDVAKYAGVSYSTVSRALADSPLVDAKTKKKVLRAAEKMHYVPNQMARSLKGGKSRTVLLIVPDLTNAFFPKMVTCFEENLRKHDYSILLGISDNTEEQENRCFERASSFGAEGIVWIACDENQERISNLIRSTDVPVILINREMDVDAACVTNDNRRGACAAVECLLQNGHRRVACLIRDVNQQHFKERYLGCQDAFRKYGISDEEVTYLCAEIPAQHMRKPAGCLPCRTAPLHFLCSVTGWRTVCTARRQALDFRSRRTSRWWATMTLTVHSTCCRH